MRISAAQDRRLSTRLPPVETRKGGKATNPSPEPTNRGSPTGLAGLYEPLGVISSPLIPNRAAARGRASTRRLN